MKFNDNSLPKLPTPDDIEFPSDEWDDIDNDDFDKSKDLNFFDDDDVDDCWDDDDYDFDDEIDYLMMGY